MTALLQEVRLEQGGAVWLRPISLPAAFNLLAEFPAARPRLGGTGGLPAGQLGV